MEPMTEAPLWVVCLGGLLSCVLYGYRYVVAPVDRPLSLAALFAWIIVGFGSLCGLFVLVAEWVGI